MQTILYFASILLTGIMAGFLTWYAWRQRDLPGGRPYTGLALCVCLLALSEGLSMLSPSLAQALFWFNVQIIFVAAIPVFFLVLALEFYEDKDWISRRILVLAFIIPVLTQLILWSNNLHGWWVKQEVGFHQSGSFWLVENSTRISGLWFWIHSIYSLVLLLTGIVVILVTTWKKGGMDRVQGLLLSAGAVIALVVTLVPAFKLLPQAELNPYTPGLGLSLLLTALAVFRFRIIKRTPAPHTGSQTQTLDAQLSRSKAVFIFIFFVMAAIIAAFAHLSYQSYNRQFLQQTEDQLLSIANLKVNELENWREERMGDAQVIQQNPAFAVLVAHWFENPADTQAQAQLQAWMDALRKYYNYDRVFLLDIAGLERISSPAMPEPVEAHVTKEEADILSAGQVTFLDFHRDTEDGSIHLMLLVPIYAEPDQYPLGLLIMRIDPRVYLYPYIQQWPIPSASSETLLVRAEGTDVLYLNELRFQVGAALNLRSSFENTQLPAVQSVLGKEGVVEGVDYRGAQVLAAILPVPDSPWFLVAKTDIVEVFAPLRERLWQTIVFFGALLATTYGGLILVWRQQRLRYYRQRAEAVQELRRSEDKFRLAFNTNPDSMAITRFADGMFVSINKKFERIFEYGEDEIVGKIPSEINIWKDPEDGKRVIEELHATGEIQAYEALFLTRNGEINGLLSASIIELNGAPHSLYIIHDNTEQKQAREKLEEERLLLRTLIDNLPDRIYAMEVHGHKIISNIADWQASGGKAMEDVIGKTDLDLFPPELAKDYWAHNKAVIDSGTAIIDLEQPGLDSQGNQVLILSTKIPLRDGEGKVVGLVGIGRDITEQKQAEAKILADQAELNRLLSEADQARSILLSIMEDQQQARMELEESEQKYRLLVDNASEAIIVGQEGILKFVNQMTCVLTGYSEQELILQPLSEFIHPDDRSMVMEHYLLLINGDLRIPRYAFRLMGRGGIIRWVEIGAVLIDWECKPATLNFLTDITERKQAERVREALYNISHSAVTARLEDLFLTIHRALGNLMPVDNFYIALYDPEADLLSFPYSVDEQDESYPPQKPGRGLTEYVLRTGRSLLVDKKIFEQLVQQGEVGLVGIDSVEWLGVPLKVGEKIFGVIAVQSYTESVRFSHADVAMLEFVAAQVTPVIERRLIQQRITDALEFNLTLINASSLGISAYNSSGQCILANEAIANIFGATRTQILGQNYNHSESWNKSGLLEVAREAATSGKETRREIHTKSEFGKEIWLDCHFTPFVVSNGEPHLLRIVEDISNAKQDEIALRAYAIKLEQSNRDLQEFAYVASHDLQEPLRKVLAFSDLIISEYGDELDETGHDYLNRMQGASQRMQTLITDLLNFSRVETRSRPFIDVDLNIIAQEVLSDLENFIERTQGHVEIGKLPTIEVDPTQLHQLLQNLIGNGLKFSHEGCSPLVKVSAKIKKDSCQISVEDNGIGFNIQYLDRIFKPFERLHSREEYEGSGMGLAICRRIVERHSGKITAISTPGEGSTFIVTLPIHQSKGDSSRG